MFPSAHRPSPHSGGCAPLGVVLGCASRALAIMRLATACVHGGASLSVFTADVVWATSAQLSVLSPRPYLGQHATSCLGGVGTGPTCTAASRPRGVVCPAPSLVALVSEARLRLPRLGALTRACFRMARAACLLPRRRARPSDAAAVVSTLAARRAAGLHGRQAPLGLPPARHPVASVASPPTGLYLLLGVFFRSVLS